MITTAAGQRLHKSPTSTAPYEAKSTQLIASGKGQHSPSSATFQNVSNPSIDTSANTGRMDKQADPERLIPHNHDHSDRPVVPTTFRVSGLDKWSGRVLEVDDEIFSAELIPDSGAQTVVADFSIDLVAAEDDLQPGDVLYVTVRTIKGLGGHPSRTSSVRVRRLGNWTSDDLKSHQSSVDQLRASLEDLID